MLRLGHVLHLQCVLVAFGYRVQMKGCDHTTVAVHRPWQQLDSSLQMAGYRAACSVASIWTRLLAHSTIDYSSLGWEGRLWLMNKLACLFPHVYCTACQPAQVAQQLPCSMAVLDDGFSVLLRCAEMCWDVLRLQLPNVPLIAQDAPPQLTHSSQHRYSLVGRTSDAHSWVCTTVFTLIWL